MTRDARADLYRVIAEYTYDWESWVDSSGKTKWVNFAVERMTGYTVDECLSHPDYPLALVCSEDRARFVSVLADARAGGSGNDVEFRILRKDGELRWGAISWQAVRAAEGDLLGYRTSVRDIEQRKRMETELHMLRRRAEAAALARTELLANVSHELRSPLHCMAGFLELLQDSALDGEQRHYVKRITSECAVMQRHVEDLLQFAALEAGGLKLEQRPFDLDELLAETAEGTRPRILAHGLALNLKLESIGHAVLGDPVRVGQVLRNLLDNAIKFTEQGEIGLRVTCRVTGREVQLTLVVSDTGVGMSPAEMARVLEPFQQGASGNARPYAGVGLGLSIVRRLVSTMGGTLRVESEKGVGTHVHVALSFPLAEALAPAAAPRVPRPPRGQRALVVDDSPIARELLCALLGREGYDTREAASGPEAVAALAAEPFDLVLLDYQMPELDGAETALALRRVEAARASGHRSAIYLLTANALVRAQTPGLLGALDGILEKPLGRAALVALLDRLAGGAVVEGAPAAPPKKQRGPTLDARVIEDLRLLRSGQGERSFAHLVERVSKEIGRALAQAEHELATGSLPELARTLHKLAGEAAMLGARVVAARARELDDALASRSPASTALQGGLQRRLRELARAWTRAERALRALDP